MARGWAIISIAIALAVSPAAQGDRASAISELLDTYDRGEFTSAVKAGAALPNLAEWRQAYPAAARAWIDRSPADVARRRLVAAGLALEVARERFERDVTIWNALRHVMEWACQELRQELNTQPGEQAWQRASVALGQRVQDSGWLAMGSPGASHLEHARLRFPADPRFVLAFLALATQPADLDIQQREYRRADATRLTSGLPSFGAVTGAPLGAGSSAGSGLRSSGAPDPRQESRQAIAAFTRLQSNAEVGAEAEAHISHLYLMLHEWQPALEHARNAARIAHDSRPRYLGSLMAGLALEQLDQRDEARAAYQEAIDALPHGQTAALLLAALDSSVAARSLAAARVSRSLAGPPRADDPWRLYYYGDYFNWPTYIEQLHEALR